MFPLFRALRVTFRCGANGSNLSGSAPYSLGAVSPGMLSVATEVSGTKPKGSLGTKAWMYKAFHLTLKAVLPL